MVRRPPCHNNLTQCQIVLVNSPPLSMLVSHDVRADFCCSCEASGAPRLRTFMLGLQCDDVLYRDGRGIRVVSDVHPRAPYKSQSFWAHVVTAVKCRFCLFMVHMVPILAMFDSFFVWWTFDFGHRVAQWFGHLREVSWRGNLSSA